jgi:GNAT superfamily N-acetyltransferase
VTPFAGVAPGQGQLLELTTSDLDDLQALFERCEDYFLLHDGHPPGPTAAADEWEAMPDGSPRDDKHLLGLFAPHLAGVVEVLQGWPRPGTWNIGLLLIEPRARSRRLGATVIEAVDAWAAGCGADTLRITVIPANVRGMAFWMRLGFEAVPAVGRHATALAFERPVGNAR